MKLNELLNEDNYYDQIDNTRVQNPSEDQFGAMSKTNAQTPSRKPTITLMHINKLKKMKSAQMAEHKKRLEIMDVMYGIPEGDGM